ncbi:hypothetical protein ACKUSY_04115 [Myroides odoratus]
MNKEIYLILMLFCINVGWAQVGFEIETPEANLDINAKIKAGNLPDVSNQMAEYNRILYADADGNIGYRTRHTDAYIYRNSYFAKMDRFYVVQTSLTDLGLSLVIPIPPMKKSLIELNYSIGVMNGTSGNASILIGRKEGNATEIILYNATRTFSFVNGYAATAAAKGRAISNMYYDEVDNNTAYVKFVTYKVYGILSNASSTNKFGMWANVGSVTANFNWGRGSLNINVFDYE